MRLWSLHPRYLDARGLCALWREGLLAQKVLRGRTTGYRHHPQLARFRESHSPIGAIAEYLRAVHEEARERGYKFNIGKISRAESSEKMTVTRGQMMYEWHHLMVKLRTRDPERGVRLENVKRPVSHPHFRIVPGEIEDWERIRR